MNDRTEEMAFHWVKRLETPYAKDPVFRKNFFQDFCKELGIDFTEEINFEQLILAYEKEKWSKDNLSKEEKKKAREERKKLREKRRKKYGIAIVDGREVEIANYIAEPSAIFLGRGQNPKRGHWKEGPREEDIVLNLDPKAKRPPGNWKKIVWKPSKMWIASWVDKLSGKRKYVWLSDTWSKKQEREKIKFDKASKLETNINKVKHLIGTALYSKDRERRKIACVCYLIYNLNMRVGDEKERGESDTVGAITLRPEHIKIEGEELFFDFLGKDSVRWQKRMKADPQFILNLKEFLSSCENYIFEEINSKKVSKFLQEAIEGLTAKVFRTWKASVTFKETLKNLKITKKTKDWEKKNALILANLKVAKALNHKKKLPKNFEEKIQRKEERLMKLKEKVKRAKKKEKLKEKIQKLKKDIRIKKLISEYNLNTSKNSYIDPRIPVKFCSKIDFPIEKFYSKAQLKKHSWALSHRKNHSKI